ncbi:efflux transporter outer membrane subunit [Brevundimonas olei]|uniref:efflux transporter outer membrane subunit n=1 Tax=Brevundimonas olei TaxID=657642 RepID=UPI0031CE6AA7
MTKTAPRMGSETLAARLAAPVMLPVLLAACMAGPNYSEPTLATPAAFSHGEPTGQPAPAWWRTFHDPMLDRLVDEARASNLDLRQATLRVEEARHQARIVGAATAPTISADAQGGYTRLSKTTSIAALLGESGTPGSEPIGAPGTAFETYQTGFDASWELDLFGAGRRALEAADARTASAVWTRRDAEIILTAEVARAYLDYRALDQRIAVADALQEVRDDALLFHQIRRRHGLTSTLDERSAERDRASIAAAREDLVAQRTAQAHALAVLLARPPMALINDLAETQAAPTAPAVIPVGLPSDLLRRRPDVRAAERNLAAATAEIGVAVADLYPSISLTGAIHLVSGSLSTLISSDSLQPTAGAALMLPLFDGGRRRATVDLRQTQAQEALLAYQGAVLIALKDVEDALSRLEADRVREEQIRAAESAARDQWTTLQAQQNAGLATALDLLAARASFLDASDARIQAQGAVDLDVVALFKALGGGWDDRRIADAGRL